MAKTAVITGGSGGIGLATARLFAAEGYKVFELSRSGAGENGITHIRADVSDEESVKNAFAQIALETDKIDALVNNAGYGISGAVEYTEMSHAKRQFDVNFFGLAAVTKAALPFVKKCGGIIVNVSSVAGALAIPFQAYYSASKAAINSLTAALANELRPFGVRATALMPGDISTGFTQKRVKLAAAGYESRLNRSVAAMEKDEKNGGTPDFIARKIFALSQKRRPKPLYTAGAKYKIFVFLGKILPARLVNKILGALYAK